MKPIQSLPNTYHQDRVVDLSKDKRLAIMLNMISVIVFLISGILFAGLASILRGQAEFSITFDNIFLVLFGLVLVIILAPVVHEGIHGVCFWYFTRGKPQFGFRGFYAYAAAPDWYLPRRLYFVVALAPLAVITVMGILLMPFVSQGFIPLVMLWSTFNLAGSVGDIALVALLLRKPSTVYINDFGDGITIYSK